MRRTFSKHGLEETWDFYQETQGPKTLESMPEAEQKVCCFLTVALTTPSPDQQLLRTAADATKNTSKLPKRL